MIIHTPLMLSLLVLAAYLLGSIPNGLLIARLKDIDLQKVGSGNIGATNVFRCVGKGWGIAAFILDAVKGFVPAFCFPRLMEAAPPWLGLACGIAAVAGHNWPVWLKFKGGKGVATFFGTLLAAAWPVGIVAGAAWLITAALFRISSLAALVAVAIAPAAALMIGRPHAIALLALFMALLVYVRHAPNIRRLLKGEEPRIGGGKKAEGAAE